MRRLIGVVIALNLTGCCNPAELIEKRMSGSSSAPVSTGSAVATSPTAESGEIPAPTTKQPMPFAAGQWTRYTVTRPNEAPSKLEYKVISTQGDAHWFEVEVGKTGKISVIQFLLVAKDRTEAKSFELREAKIRLPNGQVQVLKGMQLRATRKLIDQYLTSLRIPAFGTGPQEDAKVPAGTFKQCYVNEVGGTFFGIKTNSKTWNHPVVPISTMVRSIERTDGAEIVLEAFGLTGAKSALGS